MKYLFTLVITCLFLSGCGTTSTFIEAFDGKKEVVIEIQKSEESKTESIIKANGQSLHDMMLETQIPFIVENHGQDLAMVKLDGVMSTEGKEWRLYVNDEPRIGADITKINFNESTKISWRYETK